jgi:hypothetical protein
MALPIALRKSTDCTYYLKGSCKKVRPLLSASIELFVGQLFGGFPVAPYVDIMMLGAWILSKNWLYCQQEH